MGLTDLINAGGDALEHGFDKAKEVAGKVVDSGAHLAGDGLHAVGLDGAADAVDGSGDSVADHLGAEVAEQQLGETDDPTRLVHGDVAAIGETTGHLQRFAGAFGNTAEGLRAVDTAHWTGSAGEAFRTKYEPHPKQWMDAHEACTQAAGAWSAYGDTVRWAQGQAADAVELYARGKQASEAARQQYESAVQAYDTSAQGYNAALAAGQDPGARPQPPGEFTDPGAAQMRQAQEVLERARAQRDSAATEAQQAVSAGTALAPQEPSFAQRMLSDGADLVHAAGVGSEHLLGGVVKGTGDILKFARGLNPTDPYNLTHPAEYVNGLSTTAAGLVHGATHPVDLVKSLVGSGWGSDPFEAFGKLVPQVALAVATDGAGAAAGVGERAGISIGEDAAERGAVGIGEDAAERGATRGGLENPRDPARDGATKSTPGEPIDAATGSLLLEATDVELPGVLPLVIGRQHCTSYRAGRWFGPTWASLLDERLEVDAQGLAFTRGDGVILLYPSPLGGDPVLPAEGARWPLARAVGGGYTVTDPESGQVRHFGRRLGAAWPLSAVTDRNGNRIACYHDAEGAPTEIHHDGGYRVRVSTVDGRVSALSLVEDGADMELVGYSYTGGHLTGVTNSSGEALRFACNSVGWITEWTDRNGTSYRYTYDARGRCTYEVGSDGLLEYTFDYDGVDGEAGTRVTTVTDSLGAVRRYHVNDALQVITEVDPLGAVTRSEWDAYDRLLSRTDPLGRTTRYDYDESGNLVTLTRADGTQALASYDELRKPVTLVDPDGAVWRQEFDARGNRTALVDPAGARTTFGHDSRGALTSVVDALGRRQVVETDAAGLPVATTDPTGATTRYERDRFGWVSAVTDPLGGVTRLGWTVEGRLASRVLPDGAAESWSYDGEGNLVSYQDAAGGLTHTEYTHFDLPSARTTPDGARLEFGYDTELRLVAVTNPQELVWRYDYDPAGRMVAETDFNGRTLRYAYDAAGALLERVAGAGERVGYRRDVLGAVVELRAGAGDGPEAVTTFSHDAMGRLVGALGPDATLSCQRDLLGRVIAETVDGRSVVSRYDAAGQRVERRTPSGAVSAWAYDPAGRPLSLTTAGRTVRFERDAAGRERRRLLGPGVVLAQEWDANHRLSVQTLAAPAGADRQRVLQRRGYAYRADGYLSAVEDQLAGPRRFELDPVGRVAGVDGPGWVERYAYDAAGNVTGAQWPPGWSPEAVGERAYAGTLISRAGRVHYEHDAQGRIVMRRRVSLSGRREVWRYGWDAEDRLRWVLTPDGVRWRYRYDPLGRRIAKERLGASGSAVLERVEFAWDAELLVEQTIADRALANVRSTVWDYEVGGVRPIAQTERVEWRDAPQPWVDERFYAIVTDLVGTPSELVDPAGGLAWHAISTVWGSLAYRSNGASTPLRFPGQYYDPETGLNYNYHRYYDPETGRYTSTDPLGLAPSPNPHTYVHNPFTWTDPLGLAPCGPRLSDPNPVPRSIREQYEDIHAGNGTPRIDPGTGQQAVYQGRGLSPRQQAQWQGSREWDVLGTNHRILERPDGKLGYVLNHDYSSPFLFPGPWYPEGGAIPKRLGG